MLEMAKAADVIINHMCWVKKGELVIVTVDSSMGFLPVEETTKAMGK